MKAIKILACVALIYFVQGMPAHAGGEHRGYCWASSNYPDYPFGKTTKIFSGEIPEMDIFNLWVETLRLVIPSRYPVENGYILSGCVFDDGIASYQAIPPDYMKSIRHYSPGVQDVDSEFSRVFSSRLRANLKVPDTVCWKPEYKRTVAENDLTRSC